MQSMVLVVSAPWAYEDRAIEEPVCAAGLRVQRADDLPTAICLLRELSPDVLILPAASAEHVDHCDAVADVRRSGFAGAILAVGQSAEPLSVAAALECGADDYVALSPDPTELVARVRALSRRAAGATTLEREVGGVVLDLRRSVIRRNDVVVALTRREADLLEYLARNAGHPVSREELATHIWHAAPPGTGGTNIVDVYVSYLRRKLGVLGKQSLIRSVRGVGYELVETSDRAGTRDAGRSAAD
jgi:two-component system OmpR family response regulator